MHGAILCMVCYTIGWLLGFLVGRREAPRIMEFPKDPPPLKVGQGGTDAVYMPQPQGFRRYGDHPLVVGGVPRPQVSPSPAPPPKK